MLSFMRMTPLLFNDAHWTTEVIQIRTRWHDLKSARHEKSAGSGVGMNGYAILFHKTCVHPCIHYSYRLHSALHYWRLLTYNVFEIGIDGVRMRSNAPRSQRTSLGAWTVELWVAYIKSMEELVQVYFKVLPQDVAGETWNHRKTSPWYPVSRTRFKPDATRF
jgi:hypothetical protein